MYAHGEEEGGRVLAGYRSWYVWRIVLWGPGQYSQYMWIWINTNLTTRSNIVLHCGSKLFTKRHMLMEIITLHSSRDYILPIIERLEEVLFNDLTMIWFEGKVPVISDHQPMLAFVGGWCSHAVSASGNVRTEHGLTLQRRACTRAACILLMKTHKAVKCKVECSAFYRSISRGDQQNWQIDEQ